MRLLLWFRHSDALKVILFLLALIVLRITLVPTLYTFDSAEFATAAWTLGLPHAPGYPLYVLSAHIFASLMPPGIDVAGKVNLYSAFCLALAAPALYSMLLRLFSRRWLAFGVVLVWLWSYQVWSAGIVAEVYAAQAATLAWTGWALTTLPDSSWRSVLLSSVAFGVALGVHPGSVLFAPGVGAAFVMSRVPLRRSLVAGLVCALVFFLSLLYLPVRYLDDPSLTLLGEYDALGRFIPVDLTTPDGLLWVLSGAQFNDLFFNTGSSTFLDRVLQFVGWLWSNFLGLGAMVGMVGIWALRTRRRLLLVWVLCVAPFTLFYLTYAAPDVETMLVPLYLVWIVVFAAGWCWFAEAVGDRAIIVLFIYALALFLLNYPLVDGSRDYSVRHRAEITLDSMPEEAIVFGDWFDLVPLQYLQLVEGVRPDLRLYNLFLFKEATLSKWLADLLQHREAIVLLGEARSVTHLPLQGVHIEPVSFSATLSEVERLRLKASILSISG